MATERWALMVLKFGDPRGVGTLTTRLRRIGQWFAVEEVDSAWCRRLGPSETLEDAFASAQVDIREAVEGLECVPRGMLVQTSDKRPFALAIHDTLELEEP